MSKKSSFYFKNILVVLSIVTLTSSCNDLNTMNESGNLFNEKAIEYNDKGVKCAMINQIDSALYYYDKAIEIDESYHLPHSNKVQVYVKNKDYEKALLESQFVITKNPDFAEGWFFHGMITEWLGDSISASSHYKNSIEIFTKRINSSFEHKDANILNRAIAYLFIGEIEKGRDDIKLIAEKDKYYTSFLDLTKKEYLEDIFDPKPKEMKNYIIVNSDTLRIKDSSFNH